MILFVLTAFLTVNAIESRVSPKFLKALGGIQKALYAEQFGYSLIPIPNRILLQAKSAKPFWEISRIGGSRKHVYNYGSHRRRRRRRKRPHRRPSYYGIPTYAHTYKEYIPERRPPWIRYKKRQRYRIPYREVYAEPGEFDYYEQEIPDEIMEEYGPPHEPEYVEYDGPNRHFSDYDSDFMSGHTDLYSDGYNPSTHRVRIYDSNSEASGPTVTRVSYQHNQQKPITRGKQNYNNMHTHSIPRRPRPAGTANVMLPPRSVTKNLFRPSPLETRHIGRDVSLQVKHTPHFNWGSDESHFSYPSNHQSNYNKNSQYYNENLSRISEENFDDIQTSREENKRNDKNTEFDYGMENVNEEVRSGSFHN